MKFLQDILELDYAYLESFTSRTDKCWGILFCNEYQPHYYSANHAHISQIAAQPQNIINEVMNYFQSKGIIPRFYIYQLDIQEEFISILKENNFGFEELIEPIQQWNKKIYQREAPDQITIELVTDKNYSEALHIECSIKELGGKIVRERAFEHEFNHPKFTYYLLRYNGIACATACLFVNNKQGRLESVATLEEYRGKGLIGFLIQHIQKEAAKLGLENLWVFPINEKIEKVYQKYGFTTIGKIRMGHAYLGGKSIKEIQG
ncbi:GNAT family N-acetyltransferase [Bacillus sp. S/N-304-OC-R1]|uniref:GNAT family N-acetyltransferase n=1 Tax=Bacillus sp. S/N-304-OC-R1 TaxID=2758034 RepID=UPI001C8D962C|nr:GNAT family N-acetyltransferase [Bacillus sp. S/N-304-OC-R1]MBY0121717.1 GNAT family N-acetyltransferase [Bacillus sp. S/N-304-OC-R1]